MKGAPGGPCANGDGAACFDEEGDYERGPDDTTRYTTGTDELQRTVLLSTDREASIKFAAKLLAGVFGIAALLILGSLLKKLIKHNQGSAPVEEPDVS